MEEEPIVVSGMVEVPVANNVGLVSWTLIVAFGIELDDS